MILTRVLDGISTLPYSSEDLETYFDKLRGGYSSYPKLLELVLDFIRRKHAVSLPQDYARFQNLMQLRFEKHLEKNVELCLASGDRL